MEPELIIPTRYRLERTPDGVTLWFRAKDGRELGIALNDIDIANIIRGLEARQDAVDRH